MNLQKIAVLTGLSLASVLGSGALSTAYAIGIGDTFGAWRNTPIEYGNLRFTLNNNLTTNSTILNTFTISDQFTDVSGPQSPPRSNDFVLSFKKGAQQLSAGTYSIYYKIDIINKEPKNGLTDFITGINASATGQNITNHADGWKDGYNGSTYLHDTDYISQNAGQVIFPAVTNGYIINRFTVASGGRLTNFELSTTVTAVPWETDALPLMGATIAFGAGAFAKRKIAQAKIGVAEVRYEI